MIFILSLLGFLNAYYLHYQYKRYKDTGKKMFCVIGGNCTAVVASKFGRTFGIKNEKIGMVYYLCVLLYSVAGGIKIFIFWPILFAVAISVVFSVYLLILQTIILRKLCSWCLISIIINFSLFFFLIPGLHI